ncbi:hypothetical protein V6Z12_A03G204900 [Gossypium hirsutum]
MRILRQVESVIRNLDEILRFFSFKKKLLNKATFHHKWRPRPLSLVGHKSPMVEERLMMTEARSSGSTRVRC